MFCSSISNQTGASFIGWTSKVNWVEELNSPSSAVNSIIIFPKKFCDGKTFKRNESTYSSWTWPEINSGSKIVIISPSGSSMNGSRLKVKIPSFPAPVSYTHQTLPTTPYV